MCDAASTVSSASLWELANHSNPWEFVRRHAYLLRTGNNSISVDLLQHEKKLMTLYQLIEEQLQCYVEKAAEDHGLDTFAQDVTWQPSLKYSQADVMRDFSLRVGSAMQSVPNPFVGSAVQSHHGHGMDESLRKYATEVRKVAETAIGLPHSDELSAFITQTLQLFQRVSGVPASIRDLVAQYELKRSDARNEQFRIEQQHVDYNKKAKRPNSATPAAAAASPGKRYLPSDSHWDIATEQTAWSWHARKQVSRMHREVCDAVEGELTGILERRSKASQDDLDACLSKLHDLFGIATETLTEDHEEIHGGAEILRGVHAAIEYVKRRQRWVETDMEHLAREELTLQTGESIDSIMRENEAELRDIAMEQQALIERMTKLAKRRYNIVVDRVRRVHRAIDMNHRSANIRAMMRQHAETLRELHEEDGRRLASYETTLNTICSLLEMRSTMNDRLSVSLAKEVARTQQDIAYSCTVLRKALHEEKLHHDRTVQHIQQVEPYFRDQMAFCRGTKDPKYSDVLMALYEVQEWQEQARDHSRRLAEKIDEVSAIIDPAEQYLRTLELPRPPVT